MSKKSARSSAALSKKKSQKRHWSLVLGLVVLAIVLVSVVFLYRPFQSPGPPIPLSQALSYGSANGQTYGPNQWNNATITMASSSLTVQNLQYRVYSQSGPAIAAPPGAVVTIFSSAGAKVATYDLSSSSWGSAPFSTQVATQDKLSLYWPTASPFLSGSNLVTFGTNGYSGSVPIYLQA